MAIAFTQMTIPTTNLFFYFSNIFNLTSMLGDSFHFSGEGSTDVHPRV